MHLKTLRPKLEARASPFHSTGGRFGASMMSTLVSAHFNPHHINNSRRS